MWGCRNPFVVENGSAVFMPTDQTTFRLPDGEDLDGYRVLQLGCNYVTARAALKAIAQSIGRPPQGLWRLDCGPDYAADRSPPGSRQAGQSTGIHRTLY